MLVGGMGFVDVVNVAACAGNTKAHDATTRARPMAARLLNRAPRVRHQLGEAGERFMRSLSLMALTRHISVVNPGSERWSFSSTPFRSPPSGASRCWPKNHYLTAQLRKQWGCLLFSGSAARARAFRWRIHLLGGRPGYDAQFSRSPSGAGDRRRRFVQAPDDLGLPPKTLPIAASRDDMRETWAVR